MVFGGLHEDLAAMTPAQGESPIVASKRQCPGEAGASPAGDRRIAYQAGADQGLEARQQRRIAVGIAKGDGLVAQIGMREQGAAQCFEIVDPAGPDSIGRQTKRDSLHYSFRARLNQSA